MYQANTVTQVIEFYIAVKRKKKTRHTQNRKESAHCIQTQFICGQNYETGDVHNILHIFFRMTMHSQVNKDCE